MNELNHERYSCFHPGLDPPFATPPTSRNTDHRKVSRQTNNPITKITDGNTSHNIDQQAEKGPGQRITVPDILPDHLKATS